MPNPKDLGSFSKYDGSVLGQGMKFEEKQAACVLDAAFVNSGVAQCDADMADSALPLLLQSKSGERISVRLPAFGSFTPSCRFQRVFASLRTACSLPRGPHLSRMWRVPSVAFTLILCPVLMVDVPVKVLTRVGSPYSRPTMAV